LTEAPIVVENREELIFLLTEASELEHMVCSLTFSPPSVSRPTSAKG
jgi:hypothetical protein